ncbi:hypothetical protein LAUMK35_02145 [Mycobacterium pseudokansasii]|uniref:Uncharacterized protein n=1 Tax=Mycobacterium pseudokansasii TaxID=2341080 RepID=A0A498QRI9_9MYCO|nr:hypothetical protein LAUMK35_02145 [Mycobacterium pseudokansasii]VAZ93994.1 hypothetical protein LAUMK21_02144 [Mycobacterium pseudokansasii]VBA49547.1 hypothetical protein LAUMK142_02027 [Mycobacterium pseudokansasii]
MRLRPSIEAADLPRSGEPGSHYRRPPDTGRAAPSDIHSDSLERYTRIYVDRTMCSGRMAQNVITVHRLTPGTGNTRMPDMSDHYVRGPLVMSSTHTANRRWV